MGSTSLAGRAALEPRYQLVRGGQFIDTAATGGTFTEVGNDASQLRLRELSKGQRPQHLDTRMV